MNLVDKLDAIHVRFEEVNDLLMQPEVASDRTRFVRLNREFKELQTLWRPASASSKPGAASKKPKSF